MGVQLLFVVLIVCAGLCYGGDNDDGRISSVVDEAGEKTEMPACPNGHCDNPEQMKIEELNSNDDRITSVVDETEEKTPGTPDGRGMAIEADENGFLPEYRFRFKIIKDENGIPLPNPSYDTELIQRSSDTWNQISKRIKIFNDLKEMYRQDDPQTWIEIDMTRDLFMKILNFVESTLPYFIGDDANNFLKKPLPKNTATDTTEAARRAEILARFAVPPSDGEVQKGFDEIDCVAGAEDKVGRCTEYIKACNYLNADYCIQFVASQIAGDIIAEEIAKIKRQN